MVSRETEAIALNQKRTCEGIPSTNAYTHSSPRGEYIETLPDFHRFGPILNVQVVNIGPDRDLGISVEVKRDFLRREKARRIFKTVWFNV